MKRTAHSNQVDKLCPKCGHLMNNLGNVSGKVYTSMPEQWDEVWVCYKHQIKKTIRMRGTMPDRYTFLDYYTEANDLIGTNYKPARGELKSQEKS